MPTFTQDWFSHNIPGLNEVLGRLAARKRFLEIGCFEGLSTCWFLTHHLDPDGEMVCVDTFTGGSEHVRTKFDGVRERFQANVDEMKRPDQTVRVFECDSFRAMGELIWEKQEFDFVYIDGSHTAPDVLTDACMAYALLKVGGFLVFDDYLFGPERPLLETPKPAVDAFTTLFREKVEIVLLNYQLGVRKVG